MASLARTAFRLNAYTPLRTSYYTSRSTLPTSFGSITAARLARRTLASSSSLPPSDSGKNNNGRGKNAESKSENSTSPSSSTSTDPAQTQTVKPQRQAFASLDFAPPDPSEPEQVKISDGRADLSSSASSQAGKRTGAKSAKDSLSSIERRRRKAARFSYVALLTMFIGTWIWIGRDEEGQEVS